MNTGTVPKITGNSIQATTGSVDSFHLPVPALPVLPVPVQPVRQPVPVPQLQRRPLPVPVQQQHYNEYT